MTGDTDYENGLHHLFCNGCEINPSYALKDGNEVLVCHCTHVDGEIDPLQVHSFESLPEPWEFKTEVKAVAD